MMLGTFAVAALILATIGIYGVIAFMVRERRQEIGVRVALGATQWRVVGLVLRRGAVLAGIGVGIGLPIAFGAARLLQSLLYGTSATDPVTFAVVPLVLAATALLASYVPAQRAARVDPVLTLRND